MASCNGNKSGTSKTSKLEDSLALTFGEFVGSQIKMAEQQGMDPNEILKGLQAIAKLVKDDTTKAARSYNQGLMMGLQLFTQLPQQEQMLGKINPETLLKQISKTIKSKDSVDMAKLQALQTTLQDMSNRYMQTKGKENDKAGQKYIQEQIKKDKGFKPLANGIYYKVIKPGNGENFNDSATVDVKYVGKHIDGKVFDDSKGQAVPMSMRMTIPGFKEVVTKMKPGEKGIVIIPGAQAYGAQGDRQQGKIGPMETLVFEIEAVGVHKEEPKAMPGMPGNPGAPAPKAAPGKPAPAAKPVKK